MKKIPTSGTSMVASSRAETRLLRASVLSSEMGRWAPVRITGLGRLESMYDRAEAV
ncbi:hypothetical protein D3C87_1689720 [compost metagenome]